jgi:hypothetical protein
MSSLRANIGEKHAFSKHDVPGIETRVHNENWCTFYGRDRGEKGVEFKVAHNFEEFLEQCDDCGAEYYYIMKDGTWYCGSPYAVEGMVPDTLYELSEVLTNQKETV